MFVHTRSSAPKRFAKFGWQTRTFCHKKVIAKLESDRLYSFVTFVDGKLFVSNRWKMVCQVWLGQTLVLVAF